MAFDLNFLPLHRSHQVLKSLWEVSSQCWPGSLTEGEPSASREWLCRFLLLKLVTVLLCPHGAVLHLLVGCGFSLRALLLLHSPRVSTKPSTVLLGQLALADALVLVQWALRLGSSLSRWIEGCEVEASPAWWREAASVLGQQLLDAHHLASLLLLGLLGLEATLVSRWAPQTRRFRTSHWAQLSCGLVWMLVLLELVSLLYTQLLQDSTFQSSDSSTDTHTPSLDLVPPPPLPLFSVCLRRILWLVDSWLHYTARYRKPQKRKSSFH